MMMRWDFLNQLVERCGYRHYLEIGTRDNRCFSRIECQFKTGVDPSPRADCRYRMTSDEFFSEAITGFYDLIFIDGMHLEAQVLKDIENSLRWLSAGWSSPAGTIVLHDCNPPTEQHQIPEYDGVSEWNGTVWKAFVKLRMTRADLTMLTVDTDWGLGVIRRGSQLTIDEAQLTWEWLQANRQLALNLVSVDDVWKVLGL